MRASWEGVPPIWVSAAAALEEESITFAFRAMCMVKSSKKIGKSLKLYRFRKAQELYSNASLNENDKQLKWIDCWKTRVFYRPFSGQDTWCASRAQSEPDMHPTWHPRLHLEPSNAIFAFQAKRHVSTIIESRVSTIIDSRVSTSLRLASALEEHDSRVYESGVLSHIRSVSLLL